MPGAVVQDLETMLFVKRRERMVAVWAFMVQGPMAQAAQEVLQPQLQQMVEMDQMVRLVIMVQAAVAE